MRWEAEAAVPRGFDAGADTSTISLEAAELQEKLQLLEAELEKATQTEVSLHPSQLARCRCHTIDFLAGHPSFGALLRGRKSKCKKDRSFLLTVRSFCLRLVFVFTDNWFGPFYLRLNFGSVFLAYGGKFVFLLRAPPVRTLGLVFFGEKDRP